MLCSRSGNCQPDCMHSTAVAGIKLLWPSTCSSTRPRSVSNAPQGGKSYTRLLQTLLCFSKVNKQCTAWHTYNLAANYKQRHDPATLCAHKSLMLARTPARPVACSHSGSAADTHAAQGQSPTAHWPKPQYSPAGCSVRSMYGIPYAVLLRGTWYVMRW